MHGSKNGGGEGQAPVYRFQELQGGHVFPKAGFGGGGSSLTHVGSSHTVPGSAATLLTPTVTLKEAAVAARGYFGVPVKGMLPGLELCRGAE